MNVFDEIDVSTGLLEVCEHGPYTVRSSGELLSLLRKEIGSVEGFIGNLEVTGSGALGICPYAYDYHTTKKIRLFNPNIYISLFDEYNNGVVLFQNTVRGQCHNMAYYTRFIPNNADMMDKLKNLGIDDRKLWEFYHLMVDLSEGITLLPGKWRITNYEDYRW